MLDLILSLSWCSLYWHSWISSIFLSLRLQSVEWAVMFVEVFWWTMPTLWYLVIWPLLSFISDSVGSYSDIDSNDSIMVYHPDHDNPGETTWQLMSAFNKWLQSSCYRATLLIVVDSICVLESCHRCSWSKTVVGTEAVSSASWLMGMSSSA